jgi:hypothetical protein
MPFDPKSPKKVPKKSKRESAKKEGLSIKEKIEIRYEKCWMIYS